MIRGFTLISGFLMLILFAVPTMSNDGKPGVELDKQVVIVPEGGAITVLLPRADGTGAHWRDSGAPTIMGVSVEPVKVTTIKEDPLLLGGPSGDVFQVRGITRGRTEIEFELRRGQQPPSRKIAVVFEVR
jgi:hypothetical protein